MSPELAIDPGLIGWILLGALPLLLAACTAFTKLSVVLSALRVGLGAEALLPFGLILALAFILTILVMGPTGAATYEAVMSVGGPEALLSGSAQNWLGVATPLIEFLQRHAHPEELEFFSGLAGLGPADPRVLVPAFLVSELVEALQLVVLLLIPFVLIDLIVAQVLSLLDLTQLPPKTITLPAKLLLFLGAGGWDLVIGAVAQGYL